jgi:hypothetical protein
MLDEEGEVIIVVKRITLLHFWGFTRAEQKDNYLSDKSYDQYYISIYTNNNSNGIASPRYNCIITSFITIRTVTFGNN